VTLPIQVGPSTITMNRDDRFVVCQPDGRIERLAEEGFFARDTRFVSGYEVFLNGQLIRTIPVSLGKGGSTKGSKGETIDFWTRSGVHVLLTKEPDVVMSSASYGITNKSDPNFYEEHIKLCCRISLSGEYVHLRDWQVDALGKRNTSHGCVNVGAAHAQWFYDNFQIGDVVEVRNTPKQLTLTDGVGDWNVSWAQW